MSSKPNLTDPPAEATVSEQGAAAPAGSPSAGGSSGLTAGSAAARDEGDRIECGLLEFIAFLAACGPLVPAGSYEFINGQLFVAGEA